MHVFISVDEYQKPVNSSNDKLIIDCRQIIRQLERATATQPGERLQLPTGISLNDYLDTNLEMQSFFTETFKHILLQLDEKLLLVDISFTYTNRQHIALYFAERALDLLRSQKRKVYWRQNEMA